MSKKDLLNARNTLQPMAVFTTAVVLAWLAGGMISKSEALVASIMAVITLRTSVHASLNEAFSQILGSATGIIVGLICIQTIKSDMLSVILVTMLALIVSKSLSLGEYGVINILITALIVLGPGLPAENASNRGVGTVIGVAIALSFSYWALPSTPTSRTEDLISSAYGKLASLYSEASNSMSIDPQKGAESFLVKSRSLVVLVEKIRTQAEEALHYSKWSPISSKTEANNAYNGFVAIEHIYIQTRSLARTLFDSIDLTDNSIMELYLSTLKSMSLIFSAKSRSDTYGCNSLLVETKKDINLLYLKIKEEDSSNIVMQLTIVNSYDRILESLLANTKAITHVPTPIVTRNAWSALHDAQKRLRKVFKSGTDS